jgi:hypothetical protein
VINVELGGYERVFEEYKDSKFKIKAILFECKDQKERDEVLNETKFKIMGPYLVSRRAEE